MSDSVYKFQAAINDAGLGSPHINTDGLLHRFHVDGDRSGSKNGWYIFYLDKVCGGCFGSWKTGTNEIWRENCACLSDAQWREMKAKIAEDTHKRKWELQWKYLQASESALAMWNQSADVLFHPYLNKKRVLPFGIRQRNDLLVIPLHDAEGKIWSYQTIDKFGHKMFMKDGKVRGNFYLIGDIQNHVYITEGFATGATIHTHFNKSTVIAFNATNLKPVALVMALKYPQVNITIAADNDTETNCNPGLNKGYEAADAVGANLIYPDFNGVDGEGTDFNDYVLAGGVL